ncbi:hypothetical protein Tco_1460078 [Tanacetum coccineum]
MLTGSYTAYAPPTSGIVFPIAPLVNPTAPPSAAYTSFLGLLFDSGYKENILEGTFIKGLKPELRTAVRTQQPKGVTKAIQLTLLIDENKTGGGVPRPTASHTGGSNSKIVAGAASKPPFKRMSEAEFTDKKAKGLCFCCDGQFAPSHKYPEKSLQVMVIYDGETDEEEEEQEPAMEEQI